MPVLKNSSYKPPFLLRNAHLQTIYPSLFRKIDSVCYQQERISTPDDDFLDLDWAEVGSKKLAIISHGLEGNSTRVYVVGMVRALNRNNWDALAWNFRGCSGKINRQLRFYHSGAIEDLGCVIDHAIASRKYDTLALIGFSMGGNLTLVYLGKKSGTVPGVLKKAVVFSVPCDLKSSAEAIARASNKIYMKRFLRMLHEKIKLKMKLFPDLINDENYGQIKNFKDFDDHYTAPIHGFENAEDYWQKCSSKQFISTIQVPTLLITAQDDPFLGPGCYPVREAQQNSQFFLEMPENGGHAGFIEFNKANLYWSEKRTLEFLNNS